MIHFHLPDAAATDNLGRALAAALAGRDAGALIALRGDLGAGKTALARAALRALGHAGPVVSPTYTLVEPYALGQRDLYHIDCYRLVQPEELEFLGLRDLDAKRDWLLVEWPERGRGTLPPADLEIALAYAAPGRRVAVTGHGRRGRALATAVAGHFDRKQENIFSAEPTTDARTGACGVIDDEDTNTS